MDHRSGASGWFDARWAALLAAGMWLVFVLHVAAQAPEWIWLLTTSGLKLPAATRAAIELCGALRTVPGWLVTLAALVVLALPPFLLESRGRRARRAYLVAAALALPAFPVTHAIMHLPATEIQWALDGPPATGPLAPSGWTSPWVTGSASLWLLVGGAFLTREWLALAAAQARLPRDERAAVEAARVLVIASAPAAVLAAIAASLAPRELPLGPLTPLVPPPLATAGTVAAAVVLAVVYRRARP